jgi:hypothetical protein
MGFAPAQATKGATDTKTRGRKLVAQLFGSWSGIWSFDRVRG